VIGEEAGHLGEGEDEDQVEEQLEGGDALSVGSPPSVAIRADPAVLIRCPPLVFLPPLPFNIF
jgi:hypothetical protein